MQEGLNNVEFYLPELEEGEVDYYQGSYVCLNCGNIYVIVQDEQKNNLAPIHAGPCLYCSTCCKPGMIVDTDPVIKQIQQDDPEWFEGFEKWIKTKILWSVARVEEITKGD